MSPTRSTSLLIPLAALAFAIAHLGFEHFSGGIKTHHFLARADLPGFSNWFGLAVLPLLGLLLAARIRSVNRNGEQSFLPHGIAAAAAGSLAYGAMLATSFYFGVEQVSLLVFLGLFLCALLLPVYRIEYIFGFVVGMTFTFGSVIPLVFALVFAAISFAVRHTVAFIVSKARGRKRVAA